VRVRAKVVNLYNGPRVDIVTRVRQMSQSFANGRSFSKRIMSQLCVAAPDVIFPLWHARRCFGARVDVLVRACAADISVIHSKVIHFHRG